MNDLKNFVHSPMGLTYCLMMAALIVLTCTLAYSLYCRMRHSRNIKRLLDSTKGNNERYFSRKLIDHTTMPDGTVKNYKR